MTVAIAVFNSRGNQTTNTNTLGKDANAVATTNYLEDYLFYNSLL